MSNVPQHHMASVVRNDYTTVNVTFSGKPQVLTYKLHETMVPLVKVGSRVVVPGKLKEDGTHSQSIATVESIDKEPVLDFTLGVPYAWVIDLVDTSFWEKLTAQDKELDTRLMEAARRKAKREAIAELLRDVPEDERESFLLEVQGKVKGAVTDVEAKQVS